MKLVYKNILINTAVSVLILFIGEFSLYTFLKSNIEKEAIEHLYLEQYFMTKQVEEGIDIKYFSHNIGDVLKITPVLNIQYAVPVLEDIELHEPGEEEHFTSKKIIFDIIQNNKVYRVSILKTVDEDEGLAGSMSAIIFLSGLFMAGILVIINVFVYYKLFSPVYRLIKDVNGFSVQELKKIIPPKTSTKEFDVLGREVSKMSEQMIFDYTSMKEFTENMTHEIQTPLAVINTKIEHCIQDKDLTQKQAVLLTDAAKAISKLFNISKGLTMLCKLDNKQYNSLSEVNIEALLKQRIQYFVDFIDNKKIVLKEEYTNDITILMDISLSEILIDNILKNAIQHNIQEGKIFITVRNRQLIIANSSNISEASVNRYFERFYSGMPSQSLGLGLSIVKRITDYYGFGISYNYNENLHTIVIDFDKDKTES